MPSFSNQKTSVMAVAQAVGSGRHGLCFHTAMYLSFNSIQWLNNNCLKG